MFPVLFLFLSFACVCVSRCLASQLDLKEGGLLNLARVCLVVAASSDQRTVLPFRVDAGVGASPAFLVCLAAVHAIL